MTQRTDHAQAVETALFLELVTGHRVPVAHAGPVERFALDAALLTGKGLAVSSYADAVLHDEWGRLDREANPRIVGSPLLDPHQMGNSHGG